MDAELQAIPWMAQPAHAPVGSGFFGLYPEMVSEGLGRFEDAGLVAFPVAVLDAGALIVGLLALGDADFQLGAATDPVG